MCSIINIDVEHQTDDKIRKRFGHSRGDDDFFSNPMPMDESNLMMVDDILNIIKNEPNFEPIDIDKSVNAHINMYGLTMNSKGSFGSISDGNDMADTIIDPNDFFNEMYKSEVDYSSTFSSPSYRSTPSPTTSNSSHGSDHLNIDFNSASNQSEARVNLYNAQNQPFQANSQMINHSTAQNYHLDTPPISPPTETIATNPSNISYIQPAQQMVSPIPVLNVAAAADTTNQINIIQGTLIPITTVSLANSQNGTNIMGTNNSQVKKIKIQPKPLAIATKPNAAAVVRPPQVNGTNLMAKTIATPKQIVLPKSLVLKCKQKPLTTPTPVITDTGAQPNNANHLKFVPTTAPTFSAAPVATVKLNTLINNANVSSNRIQIAPLSHNKRPKPKSNDEVDERAVKKQMRMIKNRESACLSRKKKKEYVNTLEAHLKDLNKENHELRSENMALKDRLGQVTSTICNMCGNLITDKSAKGSETMSITRSVTKKNAAFLLAFVFMVSLNVGPYIPLSSNLAQYSGDDSSLSMNNHQIGTRGLLWIADENEATSNDSDSSDTVQSYPMCPVSVNQSESIRLASELQRWIGDLPEYFNLTKVPPKSNDELDLSKINDFLLSDKDNAAIKSFYKQMKDVRQLRKIENGIESKGRVEAPVRRRIQSNNYEANKQNSISTNDNGHIQIFSPAHSNAMKYATFFEEIHRQDDTFYVVSFHADHLLLPALAHNKTFRPKMSLMLPAWNLNNNNNASTDGIVTLMQIDCEVLNTSMIRIRESSIPENLRNRSSSSAVPSRNADNPVPVANGPMKTRNLKMRHRRQDNTTTQPEPIESETKDNVTTGFNGTDINNGFNDDMLADYDTKKTKDYKPYFLRGRTVGN